ncbi:hypothetical protein B0H21DRAFT_819577 [Amylocystis lapponica]|nr:hypothetical protein B0H21DRAFT_819577 [Amylocystis lapponica]
MASSSVASTVPYRTAESHAKREVLIHAASQVHPALHNPLLMELVNLKVSRDFKDYVVDFVVNAVAFAFDLCGDSPDLPKSAFLVNMITSVIEMSGVTTRELLVALVYVERVCEDLAYGGSPAWVCERVFLGSLILATKYVNESSYKAVEWARCTGVFSTRDVVKTEAEILRALDFNLGISDRDLLKHYEAVVVRCVYRPGYWATHPNADRIAVSDTLPPAPIQLGAHMPRYPRAQKHLFPVRSRSSSELDTSTFRTVHRNIRGAAEQRYQHASILPSPEYERAPALLFIPGAPGFENHLSPAFEVLKPEYRPGRGRTLPHLRQVLPPRLFR